MYMNLKPNKHEISFNTTTMTSLGFIIVGNLPPLVKNLPKTESLGGGTTFFTRKGGINL